MSKLSILVSALALSASLSTEARSANAPTEPTTPAAVSQNAPPRKICRTVSQLGSILARHVCATRAQWDEVVRANEADQEILRFSQHANSPTALQQNPIP